MSEKVRHPEKINKPINPIKKKPEWIRSKIIDSKVFFQTKQVVNKNNLVTVCQEANCPNITECWSKKHATFMIMGDTCTRACAFCDVKTGKPNKIPLGDYETEDRLVSPGALGGHNWMPMSYNPDTGLVYIPAQELYLPFEKDKEYTFKHYSVVFFICYL